MTFTEIIPVLVVILGSGGVLGGIYALLKLRPEAGQIVVTAAQGALIVQTGVIDSLREDLSETRKENERLRKRINACEQELHALQREIHRQHPEGTGS